MPMLPFRLARTVPVPLSSRVGCAQCAAAPFQPGRIAIQPRR